MKIDATSPVPIYHQIAEQIRKAIDSGEFAPGDQLIPLREAAEKWGVHHHTVRHAYAELARQKLVESMGPRGTRVAKRARASRLNSELKVIDLFVERVVRQAKEEYGLTPEQLAGYITQRATNPEQGIPVVHVVECSQAQADDLANQLMAAWVVRARGLCLDEIDSLPEGPIVATYFHYNEFRLRWPKRLSEINFISTQPDPEIPKRLTRALASDKRRKPVQLYLHEYDEPTAFAVAADLSAILDPKQFELRTRIVKRGKEASGASSREPALIPPRLWPSLSAHEMKQPNVFHIRYVFNTGELEALGSELNWIRSY
jgi:GntR family transcriptional regulator